MNDDDWRLAIGEVNFLVLFEFSFYSLGSIFLVIFVCLFVCFWERRRERSYRIAARAGKGKMEKRLYAGIPPLVSYANSGAFSFAFANQLPRDLRMSPRISLFWLNYY
jgi:heme/copper-type cytochrome/quinol oxidase subunit 2